VRTKEEKDKMRKKAAKHHCLPLPFSTRRPEKMNGLRFTRTMNTTAYTEFIGVK